MGSKRERVMVGVFPTVTDAKAAIRDLRSAGFSDKEIGVLSHDSGGDPTVRSFHDLEGSRAGAGAAVGAVAGAGGGAIWALGVAAGVLPAIGPIIAGGLLMAVAASALGGVAAGALVGTLVGLGMSDEEAAYYNQEFVRGGTIVVVHPGKRPNLVHTILTAHRSEADQYVTQRTLAERIEAHHS